MNKLLLVVFGVVMLAAVVWFGVLRPADPWVRLARAEQQILSMPSQIWAAHQSGDAAHEQQLIARYNSLVDRYNDQARQTMLEYGVPDTEFYYQFSHWIAAPLGVCASCP